MGYNPASRYNPDPGYDPGSGYNPGSGYDPGYASGRGYATGQGFAAARGYALVRDYEPAPAYPPTRGDQAGSGNRRLYAVPDDPRAAGPTGPHPGWGQAVAFGDQPGSFGQAGRRADIRDSGPLWPAGQAPAGQVLTVAEEQAAAITQEAWDQAAAIRQAAEREAAAIRQQAARIEQHATDQAAAIRQAAEREAAELKAALLAMSGELGRAAAFVTDNLATPTLPGTRPVALPPPPPAPEPDALFAEPLAPPATRPATRPTTKPDVRPTKPAGRPRQFKAFRVATLAAAGLVVLAIVAGSAEVATNGFKFFVFRQGNTGETAGSETDNQFLAQQATAAHHASAERQAGAPAHKSGHHAHKKSHAAKTGHTRKIHHKQPGGRPGTAPAVSGKSKGPHGHRA